MKTYTEAEMRESRIKAFCQGAIVMTLIGAAAFMLGRL